jgi:hypothetical protein
MLFKIGVSESSTLILLFSPLIHSGDPQSLNAFRLLFQALTYRHSLTFEFEFKVLRSENFYLLRPYAPHRYL